MWNIRDAWASAPLKCKANPSLARSSRVRGDWISRAHLDKKLLSVPDLRCVDAAVLVYFRHVLRT